MNAGDMAKMIVAIIVGLIFVSAILVPTVDAGKIKESANQADGSFRYYATDEIGVGTYAVSDGNLTLEGEIIGSEPANILSDKFRIIFYNGGLTLYDSTNAAQSTSLKSITFNADGSYSFISSADVESDSTENIEWFMGVAPTGNYVFGIGTYSLEVNADSTIYVTTTSSLSDGTNTYDASKYIVNAKGKLSDLSTESYVWSSGAWTEMTATTTIVDPTDVSEGVYGISYQTLRTITLDGHDNADGGMLVFVPYQYKVVADDPINDLLEVIPLLVIVGIILGIVGMIAIRRE